MGVRTSISKKPIAICDLPRLQTPYTSKSANATKAVAVYGNIINGNRIVTAIISISSFVVSVKLLVLTVIVKFTCIYFVFVVVDQRRQSKACYF